MKTFLLPVTCLTFSFFFVFLNTSFSQDNIILRNNDVIKAKVEEVGVHTIKYHKDDNIDGPIYDIPKGDVYMIIYNNGTRDVINPLQGGDVQQGDAVVETTIKEAPPEMPVYEQPACPVEGYLWTPGYWAYGLGGYYWVPGVWISPPHIGYLWTPGYWGFENDIYGWHEGYWGEHIGYYGGVNYGYGYVGRGYEGGRWESGSFRYNTAVSHVDETVIHTTYVDNTVVRNTTVVNRSSFNGAGGVKVEPTPAERKVMNENHVKPTSEQKTHIIAAKNDKSQYVSTNHGKPAVTSMNKANGAHFSSEGHVTNTNNTKHTGTEIKTGTEVKTGTEMKTGSGTGTNTEHSKPAEQHTTQPIQSHSQQSTQQQHTNQPIQSHSEQSTQQQHTTQPVQSHSEQSTQQQHTTQSASQQNQQAPTQKKTQVNTVKPVQKTTQKPAPIKDNTKNQNK